MRNAEEWELFVGREKEIAYFSQWLTASEPEKPWILYLYDELSDPSKKGGVGKTWLLRKFSALAKQISPDIVIVLVDFFNIADRDGVVIAERIVTALKAAHPIWEISATERSLAEYNRALLNGTEDAAGQHNRLADALIADLHVLDTQLNGTGKRLLVFFDTYELVQDNPLVAALRLEQAFPDDYNFSGMKVVLAGRYELDWSHPNWRGRGGEVQCLPIAPFTVVETKEYFDKLSNVNASLQSDDMQALHERTEGRPILVSLVNDVLNRRTMNMTLQDLMELPKVNFEASLVAKFNELAHPIDQIVLFMAHVYHRFNLSLLERILREPGLDYLAQKINPVEVWRQMRLSFVRRSGSGDDVVLHDEMRSLVRRYCWDIHDLDRSSRKHLSECAIAYYEDALQHIQSEQQRQAYTVELLYHKLYVNLKSGYEEFTEILSRIVNLRLKSVARSLLQEARHFEKEMTAAQRYHLKYEEARLLSKEENAERALNLFQQLEQEAEPQWLDKYRANILFEKGTACDQLSRYSEAIGYFKSSMKIEKARNNMLVCAYLHSWLGSVYRKQGELDTALRYYEEGLEINRGLRSKSAYANVLLNISWVYRLQGRTEEALRRAKTSLRIREDLFKQGKISEVYVGHNYTDIGIIYYKINDLQESEKYFQEAHDIYARTGYKKGLATVYNHLGEFSMSQNALLHARQWFEKAYSTALGIDAEQQINSLNKRGRLLVMEDQYQKAIGFFQQAIDLAKEVHDDCQHAESLIDLADVFKRAGQEDQSLRALQAAREICLRHNYYFLLGCSKMYEGDLLCQRGDYKAAFRNYGEACYYLTRYNNLEYQKGLRRVIDTLFVVPLQELGPIVDELVAYWSTQGLEKEYPDFVKSFQEVKSLGEF